MHGYLGKTCPAYLNQADEEQAIKRTNHGSTGSAEGVRQSGKVKPYRQLCAGDSLGTDQPEDLNVRRHQTQIEKVGTLFDGGVRDYQSISFSWLRPLRAIQSDLRGSLR